ncbi:MAG: class I SAM-dependent methyltransferase, partial [Candidatus Dormibacteria bacterium]
MTTLAPSQTAIVTAVGRAIHLFNYGPRALLADWLAWPFLGADAEAILAAGRAAFGEWELPFTNWIAARSRVAEDWLGESSADQYAILGAGLDSFAWRQEGAVKIFEVDQPATQAWKVARVAALGLPVPREVVWVPVDFEQQSVGDVLAGAELDTTRRTFVSWLGVV